MKRNFYTTKRVNEAIATNEQFAKDVTQAVGRFSANDWGNIPQEDKEVNNRDMQGRDGHILARYGTCIDDIYINTDFYKDADYCLVMFCNEY